MGQSTKKLSRSEESGLLTGMSAPEDDYIRFQRDTALIKSGSDEPFRMAGSKLSEIGPTSSISEDSRRTIYSPDNLNKSTSKYLNSLIYIYTLDFYPFS